MPGCSRKHRQSHKPDHQNRIPGKAGEARRAERIRAVLTCLTGRQQIIEADQLHIACDPETVTIDTQAEAAGDIAIIAPQLALFVQAGQDQPADLTGGHGQADPFRCQPFGEPA